METPEKTEEATLPLLTPKTAGGSQRIIKQIMVIDPNKLRLAGLDVKMAEALKKAKGKSQPRSKEGKLAAAKSILNKKLKEALSKKDLPKSTSPQTTSKTMISIEEAARKLSSSVKNKVTKTKPKISVATLKSLMPPPSFPVSSLISPNQTVEIKVLKSQKTKQSIEVKIVDSSGETPEKIEIFPKASLKTPRTPKAVKTQAVTPEVKLKIRKKSSFSEDPDKSEVSTKVGGESTQTVIVHLEDKKNKLNSGKEHVKEKDISECVHSKSLTNDGESTKNMSPKIVHGESSNEEKPMNEKAIPIAYQGESLVTEAKEEALIESTFLPQIDVDSLPKLNASTPIRRESLPKVIESKVLSPGEKIDLSILTKKSPVALTVPKKRYKLDQNWITETNRAEPVYTNLSPVPKPTPPKAVVQESAVDFINNLSLFLAESKKNKSQTKYFPEMLTKECGEDATSFLVSLFQKKQDTSLKTKTSLIQNDKGSKAANDDNIEQIGQDSSWMTSSKTTNTQVLDLDKKDSPKKKSEDQQNAKILPEAPLNNPESSPNLKTLQETTLDISQSSSILSSEKILSDTTLDACQNSSIIHSEEISIQDNKSIISISEKDNKSMAPIENPTDLAKPVLNETLFSSEGDKELPNLSISLASKTSPLIESLQKSVPESSTQPVSSRRKASKPIPVLIPKLRKSRKSVTPAQKSPAKTIPQKATEKPEEESPTQPVQKEACKDSVPSSELVPCQTEEAKEVLPHKSTQTATENTLRSRRDTPKSEEESLPSLASKDSVETPDELPTTSKTERPQRQRKISLKLIESSEFLPTIKSHFQGVVDRTVEQNIKNKKESAITTERPQRQRKVSFKLLESSESLPTIVKPPVQIMENPTEQEKKGKKEMATKTERPQRQRRITIKLLESSESLSNMKSLVQIKNPSLEREIKEKTPPATETAKPCMEKNTEHSNLDSLIAIEMGKGASKDPIAQLVAFHETVEKFELACGSVKSKVTENRTTNLEGEVSSLSEYPFYDAICSEISNEHIQSNQPNEVKENVSDEKISTKVLRKRKDSLKSRKFGGDQISIVSSDSLEISECTPEVIKNVPSVKQTGKLKETPTIHQSQNEEVQEMFESTPKLSETKSPSLITEVVKNEQEFSLNSQEMVNNSGIVENLDVTPSFSKPLPSTNTETPMNSSFKKRRGRPPKVRRRKLGVVDSDQLATTDMCKNVGGSWETILSIDDHLRKEVPEVEVVEKLAEVSPPTADNCCIQPKTTAISKSYNFEGSWETLPSGDEHLSQEVTISKSGSKSATKKTEKPRLKSSKSRSQERTPDDEDKVDKALEINSSIEKNMYKANEISVNIENDTKIVHKISEEVVTIEDNETPRHNRKRGRPPKSSKQLYNLSKLRIGLKVTSASIESEVTKEDTISRRDANTKVSNIPEKLALETTKEGEVTKEYEILKRARPSNVSKISEKLILETTKEPLNFYEITHEVENHEEKPSTSKSTNYRTDLENPIEDVNAAKNTPDEYETSECIENSVKNDADVEKTLEKGPVEPSKVQSQIDKEQSLSGDDPTDYLQMAKTFKEIETSNTESRTIGSQDCEIQCIPKDVCFDELKSPTKVNKLEHLRDCQVNEPEVNLKILESNSCVPLKTLEAKAVHYQVSEENSKFRVELCDNPKPSETSNTIENRQESKLSISQATTRDNLCGDLQERMIDIETSKKASSVVHISERQSICKDDIKEINPPKPTSDISEQYKDLPKTKEIPKIVPHFEDLMFDMDHIESPSFSPIGESSRISNDSDGFEELDEDFTSAIIDTVKEAENSSDKLVSVENEALEKSLNSSGKNSKSPTLMESKSKEVIKSPLTSSENPKLTESSALHSTVLATENSISAKIKLSSDFELCKKISKDCKSVDGQTLLSFSSFLPEKQADDTKQIETPKSNEVGSKVKKSALHKNSPEKSKPLEEVKCEKALPISPLHSPDLTKKSSKDLRTVEKLPSADKIKPGSALYGAILNLNQSEKNKKEPRKNKAKNPFKVQIPKDNENESSIKSQTDFLGFNEKEIEDGQQSTSLRLSQSEDAESCHIESPSISIKTPEHNIRESQRVSGRKQKLEQKWEKKSAKSLKSWLTKQVRSGYTDVCDTEEKDTIEQTSSIPQKKRRSKVQNLADLIPLKKDVNHLEDVNTIIKPVTEIDVSVEENSSSSDKKEKPKRGRKPKLKNVSKVEDILREDNTSSDVDMNSSLQTSINVTPKGRGKLKVNNDEEFKPPRSARKSKVKQSIDLNVKKETCDNVLTPMKESANKRKRSVSGENTPTITEPPTKVAHLDKGLLCSGLFQSVRKRGRPRKSMVHDSLKVTKTPAAQTSPMQKKYKDDYEFNPRLLLVRNREELKSNEPLVDPNLQTERIGPDDVQCALCLGYTPRKKWIQHVSSHYGVGWIVGQPPPLNINSRGSILSFIIEFYKVSKVKGLNCRICNSLRRSGLGLMMHLEQCCLTEEEINENKVVCEYCKRTYSKPSIQQHKRTCSEYLKLVLEETKAETPEVPEAKTSDEVLSNTGRMKRKAVIMAETKLKKLDEAPEFSPDDLIKFIPSKNIRSIESIKENWLMEINSFGKGFCASKTCRFTAITIDDLMDHYQDKVCSYYEKAGYFCMKCKFHDNSIESVRSHVIERHSPKQPKSKNDSDAQFDSSDSSESIVSEDDEGDGKSGSFEVDENGERKRKRIKKRKLKARRRNFQAKNPPTKDYRKLLPERCSTIHDVVARFYDKFIETNYSIDPLFTFARTNFVHMEASESYFPKSVHSIKFLHNGFHGFVKILGESKVEPDQWKQLERLHGLTENGEYTIYMGGPVKNIAWVPLDPHPPSNTQYLAVTVRKGLDKFIRFCNQKRSRSLIFILKFDISLLSEIKAEIIYAIAIDEGPIHAIEFLPSGGYSSQMNRLGMLAVGTIESEIKIYSLPLKVEKLDCDFFPIVRLEASIELHLELLDNPSDRTDIYSSQCTSLVWSQTAGHNIIVGSFVNGFVGIWDISDDEGNLNRFHLNEKRRFTPISYFWTSEDRLNHLALHYDMNGPRWLVGSNSTRKMLLYDLRDITQPILLRAEVTINIINCIEWPVAWENIFFGLGDAMPSNGCVLSAFSPMSIMYQTRRFDKFCTGVTDIHYNIWRNSFAAGADNGDVQVTPLREAVLDVSQRLKTDEKTIFTLDIVPLNGGQISQNGIQTPPDGMRVFDKDFKDQYGIVFGSMRKIKGYDRPEYYNTQRVPPFNLHRLMRVTKIRYNQNKNACDVLAVGYDNGLLRVSMRDWLKKDCR